MAKKRKYTKKDAAKGTKTSTKQVSKAWHQARSDAQKSTHSTDKGLTRGWKRGKKKKKS